MASSSVTPKEVPTESASVYKGKGSAKVTNPISGEEIKVTGDFILPLAQNADDALNMVGSKEEDLVFWFNFGRKAAARQVVAKSLGMDFGTEEKNDLFKSFDAAISAVRKGMSEARIKALQDFILSEEKYAPIREDLMNWTPDHKTFDFSKIELEKPDSKRGPKFKSKTNESEDDSDE